MASGGFVNEIHACMHTHTHTCTQNALFINVSLIVNIERVTAYDKSGSICSLPTRHGRNAT